jgi:hypothetical protein
MLLALTLAVVSRRELFSRIVLVGVATVLLLLMVVSLFSMQVNSAVESEKTGSMKEVGIHKAG